MNDWHAEAVGKMHINKITNIELAKYLGVSIPYISEILNDKKSPKGIKERILSAIDAIIEAKSNKK